MATRRNCAVAPRDMVPREWTMRADRGRSTRPRGLEDLMYLPGKTSTRTRVHAAVAVAVLALLGLPAPAQATPAAAAAAAADVQAVCGTPQKGHATCFALRRTDVPGARGLQTALAPAGYGADDLQSAYRLPAGGGAGETVAIVDAYDDPNAEDDLAVY